MVAYFGGDRVINDRTGPIQSKTLPKRSSGLMAISFIWMGLPLLRGTFLYRLFVFFWFKPQQIIDRQV
jgi:hypothetical protein